MSNDLTVNNGLGSLPAPASYAEVFDLADRVARSGMVPAAYRGKPDDCAVGMMFALEQGAPPLTSLSFIAVINGKPGWHSDAVPGLAFRKRLITDMEEWFEGEGDGLTAVCEVTKPNGRKVRQTFSIADAKQAGLYGKSGPWTQYRRRMMQWRARSWAIRDAAPHAFFGPTVEELQDVNADYRGPERAKEINPADARAPASIDSLDDLVDFHEAEAEVLPPERATNGHAEPELDHDPRTGEVIDDPYGFPKEEPLPPAAFESAKEAMEAMAAAKDTGDLAVVDQRLAPILDTFSQPTKDKLQAAMTKRMNQLMGSA